MKDNKSRWTIKLMSDVLGVSEQGYYKWLKRDTTYKHKKLLAQIMEIRAKHPENENYGVQRIFLDLKINYGFKGSYSTIHRICKENRLILKVKRRPNAITKADRDAQASENIINQDFTALQPNEKWLGDITEIETADGKLYLSAILDCYDGVIVGFKIDDNMRAELCEAAFVNACKRHNAYGMIFHSDRGSQYTSGLFRKALARYKAIQSMSYTGKCYDNARMESFFATLKKEKLYKLNCKNIPREQVKSMIFRYIEGYYNINRIYTTNNGYPPLVYRKMYEYDNQKIA
jgi:transposase InsO family protein